MSFEEANVFLHVEGEKIDDNLFVNCNGIKIPFGKDDNKIKIDVKDISTCSLCNKKNNINVMTKENKDTLLSLGNPVIVYTPYELYLFLFQLIYLQ